MPRIKLKNCLILIFGGSILAFGLFNVHSFAGVTEGGTLGMTLLLDKWTGISPAVTSIVLNGICYFIGFKTLGREFICYSAISCLSFAGFYALFEVMGPLFPTIAEHRLLAAVLGAVFVGVGVGLSVRFGGAPCGDDALAMSINRVTGIEIRWVYLISDALVLGLSLTYIPLEDILYSLLTVVLSGQIIGFIDSVAKTNGNGEHNPPK